MGYNSRHFLNKVEKVQQVYKQYKNSYTTDTGIYKEYIKDVFFISKRTFEKYLAINVKMGRKKIEENAKGKSNTK